MEIKTGQVISIYNILQDIIDNNKDVDSSIKFKFLLTMNELTNVVSNFEKMRNEKINELGKDTEIEDENGEKRIVKAIDEDDVEARKNFSDTMNEIINSDIEVNIQKFKSDEIFNKGITSQQLVCLLPIIED